MISDDTMTIMRGTPSRWRCNVGIEGQSLQKRQIQEDLGDAVHVVAPEVQGSELLHFVDALWKVTKLVSREVQKLQRRELTDRRRQVSEVVLCEGQLFEVGQRVLVKPQRQSARASLTHELAHQIRTSQLLILRQIQRNHLRRLERIP